MSISSWVISGRLSGISYGESATGSRLGRLGTPCRAGGGGTTGGERKSDRPGNPGGHSGWRRRSTNRSRPPGGDRLRKEEE
jgi:hypothetical protein